MNLRIDIAIGEGLDLNEERYRPLLEQAIQKTLEMTEIRLPQNAELSVLFTTDADIKQLNHEWRDKDKPTNVLSFPSKEMKIGDMADMLMGDIVISLETTRREADEENKPLEDHLTHLTIHGFLHLFGYDHEEDEEALQMEAMETRILKELGIKDPHSVYEYE